MAYYDGDPALISTVRAARQDFCTWADRGNTWPRCRECQTNHPHGAFADRFPGRALDLIGAWCPERARIYAAHPALEDECREPEAPDA